MQKEEVRIGNIVDAFGYETIVEITQDSFHFKSGNGCNHRMPKAVTVSLAILLKAGFATREDVPGAYYLLMPNMNPEPIPMNQLVWINGNLFLHSWDDQRQLPIWDKDVRGPLALHHLQNLYYDLNDEELEISL